MTDPTPALIEDAKIYTSEELVVILQDKVKKLNVLLDRFSGTIVPAKWQEEIIELHRSIDILVEENKKLQRKIAFYDETLNRIYNLNVSRYNEVSTWINGCRLYNYD